MKTILSLFSLFLGITIVSAQENKAPVYDMDIRINPAEKKLAIKGTVRVYSDTDSLAFELEKSMGLAAFKGPDELVESIRVDSSRPTRIVYIIKLKKRLKGELKIEFSYSGGSQEGFQYYLAEDGCFASAFGTPWYPQQLVKRKNGGYGFLNGKGKLHFQVPEDWVPVVTGAKQTKAKKETNDYSFEIEHATKISFCAGKYQLSIKDDIEYYYFKKRDNIDEYIEGCNKVLSLLTEKFGSYPFPNFTLVEIPNAPANRQGIGGASYQGGIWMPSQALEPAFNLALYGHEIGHQWWGNLVFVAGDEGLGMLDEALAQYGSLLAVEEFAGKQKAEQYRRIGYPGYILNQSGLGYLKQVAAGNDFPLSNMSSRVIHDIADSKGFIVYEILAETVGKEKFHKFLASITKQYGFGNLSWKEFLDALEKEHGSDLEWFYEQWFNRKGAPEWTTEIHYDGNRVAGTITQTAPLYRLNLEVLLKGDKDSTYTRFNFDQLSQPFEFKADFPIREIIFDPHFKIIHWDPAYKKQVYDLAAYTKINRLRGGGKFAEADSLYQIAIKNLPIPDDYGVKFLLHYEKARLEMVQGRSAAAIPFFQLALSSAVKKKELLPWLHLYLAVCAREVGDEVLFKKAVADMYEAEKMLSEPSGALVELKRRFPDEGK